MHGAEGDGHLANMEEKLEEEIAVTGAHEGISETHN